MTISEKKAIIRYLEFGLLNFCEKIEPTIDPDGKGMMYEEAYKLLIECEITFNDHATNAIKTH